MIKRILLNIALLFLLVACNEQTDLDDKINTDSVKNSNSVNLDSEDLFIEIESKKLIAPKKLFLFYPDMLFGIELNKQSSGITSLGLGQYTTSTGTYDSGDTSITITLSDFFKSTYYPDSDFYKNMPNNSPDFVFNKIEGYAYLGFNRTHKAGSFEILEVLLFDRYRLKIENNSENIENFNLEKLIQKFDLENLEKIKSKTND